MSNTNPHQINLFDLVLAKAKLFLALIWHSPCFSHSQHVLDTTIHTNKLNCHIYYMSPEGKDEPNIISIYAWNSARNLQKYKAVLQNVYKKTTKCWFFCLLIVHYTYIFKHATCLFCLDFIIFIFLCN
jgi:hypothetical protein